MSAGLQCKRSWVQILASTLELFQKSQNSLFNWGHKWTWMLTLRLCLLEVLGYIRKVLGRDRKVLGCDRKALGRDRKALGCVRKALSCIRIGSLGWVQNPGSIRGNDVRSREKIIWYIFMVSQKQGRKIFYILQCPLGPLAKLQSGTKKFILPCLRLST